MQNTFIHYKLHLDQIVYRDDFSFQLNSNLSKLFTTQPNEKYIRFITDIRTNYNKGVKRLASKQRKKTNKENKKKKQHDDDKWENEYRDIVAEEKKLIDTKIEDIPLKKKSIKTIREEKLKLCENEIENTMGKLFSDITTYLTTDFKLREENKYEEVNEQFRLYSIAMNNYFLNPSIGLFKLWTQHPNLKCEISRPKQTARLFINALLYTNQEDVILDVRHIHMLYCLFQGYEFRIESDGSSLRLEDSKNSPLLEANVRFCASFIEFLQTHAEINKIAFITTKRRTAKSNAKTSIIRDIYIKKLSDHVDLEDKDYEEAIISTCFFTRNIRFS